MLEQIKCWARALKRDTYAIWLAARDPRTPWFVIVIAMATAAYALSPIDLIPDFIPVLGYLDDLIIVPLGIWLVVRLIPVETMNEYRKAASNATERPNSRIAIGVIIAIWITCTTLLVKLLL